MLQNVFPPLILTHRTDFPADDVLSYGTCIHLVRNGNACSLAGMYKCVSHSITSKVGGSQYSEEQFKQKQIC